MNFRTTTILLVILALVGIVLIFTRDTGGPKTEEAPATKLLGISSGDITKIAITSTDEDKPIVLVKNDGKWELTEPVKGAADDQAASSLADALASAESRGKIDANSDTGLDQPHFKLEVTTKDGKTTQLDVGSRSGVGNNLYVRRDRQTRADVIQADLYTQLDKPLKQWRRDKLFDAASTDIKQIRIATTQGSVALEKQGNDWKIAQPTSMPADLSAVTDIAIAATNLRADDFVSDNANDTHSKKYGLDEPVMSVSFSTAAPSTQPSTSQPAMTTVEFGRIADVLKTDVFASTSAQPGVVKIAASSLDSFRKKPLDLRDKKILTIEPDKVNKISIKIDKPATTQPATKPAVDETVVLEHAKVVVSAAAPSTAPSTGPATQTASTQPSEPPSKWQVASKDGAVADDSKVDQLLGELNPLRADKFLESPKPTTRPAGTYTLTIDTTDATHQIQLVDPGNNDPLIGSYDGLTFEVSRMLVERMDADFVKKPTVGANAPPIGVAAPSSTP